MSGEVGFRREGPDLTPAAEGAQPKGEVGLELAERLDLAHHGPGTSKRELGAAQDRPSSVIKNRPLWYHSSELSVKVLTLPKPLDSLHLTAEPSRPWWTSILACPDCRADLRWEQGTLSPCGGCGRSFEVRNGVPLLHPGPRTGRSGADDSGATPTVSEAGQRFFVDEPGRLDQLRRRHPRLARILELPDFTTPSTALPRCGLWQREHVATPAPGERILNLGSGVRKLYDNPNLVNFDIAPHENADVAGDGESLPFRDASFDGVVLDAVIEHLAHPHRVVAEVRRVLKPGGVVLAHVPFLYPFHAAPHDYQRYTPAGLEALFEDYEVLESGTDKRPGRALLEVLTAYAATFSDSRTTSYALRWITAWIWLPIKFLDPWLAGRSRASYVVASSSILARKSAGGGRGPE
jgi:SAM-dependent methyltransferase